VVELKNDLAGNVFAYMRADGTSSTTTNIQLYDQPEFIPFRDLYGFYEVRGMKAEMTCADSQRISGSGMYAGPAPGLPNPSGVP